MNVATTPTPSVSPFKFLDAYTAADIDRFFGREKEENQLVELIFSSRLILVYGASGTGKSSLVQCGLAKKLASTDYFPVVVRRRNHLPTALTTALLDAQTTVGMVPNLATLLDDETATTPEELITELSQYLLRTVYLIFDQFEELFVSGSANEQDEFFDILKRLYGSRLSCKLLIVMREEYIAHLYRHEQSLPSLFDFRLRVEPMSDERVEDVIVGTLEKTDGVNLLKTEETEVARLIIANTRTEKNTYQLPYLQVYLDRVWRKGTEQPPTDTATIQITPQLVEEVGKLDNVLETFLTERKADVARSLTTVFADERIPIVTKVLEAFVTYDGTRRAHKLDSLQAETGLDSALLTQILDGLYRTRIVGEDEGTYELPHDSLAKVIDAGRDSEQRQLNAIIRRLKEAYRYYIDNEQPEDLLLTSRQLSEIKLYWEGLHTKLPPNQADNQALWAFIDTSETTFYRAQKRKARRLYATITALSVLFLLAIASVIYAIRQWNRSNEQSLIFLANELSPIDALQVLGWVWQESGSEVAEKAIYERINSEKRLFQTLNHQDAVFSVAFSPDGQRILTGGSNEKAYVWSLSGQKLSWLRHQAQVTSVAFSPDGKRLLTGSDDGKAYVWSSAGQKLASLVHQFGVTSVAFFADGQRLLTGGRNGKAYVWSLSGQKLDSLVHQDAVLSVTFSPDGKLILTGTGGSDGYGTRGTAYLWSSSGQKIDSLKHDSSVNAVAFSPDGQRVLTDSYDGDIAYVWSLSGQKLASLVHQDRVTSVAFSPNGQRLLTGSYDGKAYVWSSSGEKLDSLVVRNAVFSVAFSPDGQRMLTGGEGGKAYVWNSAEQQFASLEHEGDVKSVAFSSDGRRVLTGTDSNSSGKGTAYLWSSSGQKIDSLKHDSSVNAVAFSPDGQRVLTGSGSSYREGKAYVWSLLGHKLDSLEHEMPVNAVAFSRDGQRMLTGSGTLFKNGKAYVWSLSGQKLDSLVHQAAVNSVAFSPDGQRVLTGSDDGKAYVWSSSGQKLDSLVFQHTDKSVAFSPDGQRVLTGINNRKEYVWSSSEQKLYYVGHQGAVYSVAFSKDGYSVAVVSGKGKSVYRYWTAQGAMAILKHMGYKSEVSDAIKQQYGVYTSFWEAVWASIKSWFGD